MEDINLHFTGDFHAITAAHNLLAAVLDNHVVPGQRARPRRRAASLWKRVLDMNDRALRNIVIGLGGPAHGVPARVAASRSPWPPRSWRSSAWRRDLAGPQGAPRADRRRRDRGRPHRDGRRAEGGRRAGRAAEGRDPAQPRADARGDAGLRPRRAVRQHRARLQQPRRHAAGAEARRGGGDRGRVRQRPRRREVLRHQVPRGRAHAGGGRDRRHRARAQDARRRRARGARQGGRGARSSAASRTSRSTSRTCGTFGVPAVVALNHFTADTEAEVDGRAWTRARSWACPRASRAVWADGGAGGAERRRGRAGGDGRRGSKFRHALSGRAAARRRRSRRSPRGSTARRDHAAPGRGRQAQALRPSSATGACPSAWPRRRTRCPTTRRSSAGPADFTVTIRDAKLGGRRGLRRGVRRRHPDDARAAEGARPRRRSTSTPTATSSGCSSVLLPGVTISRARRRGRRCGRGGDRGPVPVT